MYAYSLSRIGFSIWGSRAFVLKTQWYKSFA